MIQEIQVKGVFHYINKIDDNYNPYLRIILFALFHFSYFPDSVKGVIFGTPSLNIFLDKNTGFSIEFQFLWLGSQYTLGVGYISKVALERLGENEY